MTRYQMTRIKVCGMTRRKDVLKAVELGVDGLGFILAESPRRFPLKMWLSLPRDSLPSSLQWQWW